MLINKFVIINCITAGVNFHAVSDYGIANNHNQNHGGDDD